ncbi:unnamed protein product [Tuber melanosporum]|uniref:(Perigord truffle) hypothetical protein n=1 Tax=Tuber melanosporum (strain Mel28) TaxID=656061 RepID=D5GEP9_TUBMM|nr:uncharacterized protein GSTUM_00001321001 [Tuber melanosporum]CAZ82992.1 unnamed protein product [Tuber melanosporum]
MAPSGICISCHEALTIPDEDHPLEPGLVGDVELRCGHHYHWSCFAEEYSADGATPATKAQCPTCTHDITTNGKLLVTLRNEGGEQPDTDIGTLLEEEEFYGRNPEMKEVRAFLEFCAEGDEGEVREMLAATPELVSRQDHETGQTGLHVAVMNGREEVIRVLFKHNVDRLVTDAAGKTAYQLAVDMGATREQLRMLCDR